MKIAPLLFIVLSSSAFAQGQPPKLITGPDAPLANDCQVLHTGDVYVRSENPANGPIEVFRCTQTGAISYGWMPIDHFVGATLPPTCSTGAIAFQTGVTAGQNLFLCTANTWTAAATASAAGWTDNGTTITAAAGRNVAIGTTVLAVCGGIDDTAVLQAKLNIASVWVVGGASCKISTAIIIPSWTHLKVSPNTTISFTAAALAAGGQMLTNYSAANPVRTASSCSISSGSASLTCTDGAFTGADVGRTIVVANGFSSSPSQPMVANVTVVTSGTNVTLATNAAATIASGGSITVYNRDKNIEISGGTWARGSAGGSGTALMTMWLHHIDGLYIHDLSITSTAGKFAISQGDITNFLDERITLSVYSDGVHTEGPASTGAIRHISGSSGDDMVPLTTLEWAPYNTDTGGSISGVVIEDIEQTGAGNAVKLVGGTGTTVRNVTARNLRALGTGVAFGVTDDSQTGSATDVAGIVIEDIYGTAPILVQLQAANGRDLTVRNMAMAATSATPIGVTLASSWDSLVIDGVSHSADVGGNPRVLQIPSGKTLSHGIVSHMVLHPSTTGGAVGLFGTATELLVQDSQITYSGSSGPYYLTFVDGSGTTLQLAHNSMISSNASGFLQMLAMDSTLTNLTITGASLRAADTNQSCVISFTGGTLGRYSIDVLNQYQGKSTLCVSGSGTVGPGSITASHVVGANRLANFAGVAAVDLTVTATAIESPINPAIFASTTAVTLRGSGIDRVTAWAGFDRNAAEVLHSVNIDWPADVRILARGVGDRAYNTNAASACGVGPVISDGTNYKSLYSGTVCD